MDYYFDWLSWGVVIEFAVDHSRKSAFKIRTPWRSMWNGFMLQIGPCGVAFRWPKMVSLMGGVSEMPAQMMNVAHGQQAGKSVGGPIAGGRP